MNIKKRSKRQNVEASKNEFDAVRKALNDKLYDALAEYMKGLGFDLNEISEYSVIDIRKADDGRMVVEVRAELDYEDLDGLLNVLDPIIQKYDPTSYFEPVTPGIAEAYIDLDYKESPKDWLDNVVDALDKYEGTVISNDGTTIEIEFDNSRMLNKFADALNLESHSISDTDGSYVAYVPVTKVESAANIEATDNDSSIYDNREVVTRNGHDYAVRYTSIDTSPEADPRDMFDQFKFSISRLSPYDDAEYAWCKGEQGVVKCYRSGKLVNKTFYMDADDMDVENYEWCDEVIEGSIKVLEQLNHSIKPKMIYNSTDVEHLKKNYERRKAEFDRYGEKDNNDVLTREEKMNIAKAEYKKALNSASKVEGASYGGAYDIEDDMYFTMDDIVEFAYDVRDNLDEILYDTFDVAEVYMDNPRKLHLSIERASDGSVFDTDVNIDMRKIRLPKDLSKYVGYAVYDIRQQIEQYDKDILSASKVEAGPYDYPEPPLDPPEYDEPEEVEDVTEYVETSWDGLIVTVDSEGFWEYENMDWAKSPDTKSGDWQSFNYPYTFRDPSDVVEDVDAIVEPFIPKASGVYKMSADFILEYNISNLYADYEYYPDSSYDEDLYYDDMEVTFNQPNSEVKNFKAVKVK